MSMVNNKLNLARTWRSKQFDEIVGQDLAVRLVKNSLYRNVIFPVYLLSGMRGCGKTSMGRLFAAALNCELLPEFQKQPQQVALPCLACRSCKAMQQQAHPDFIEIDAASHTGVDNIRQLIDVASFVPVLGSKKIFLIDEAHMLSKAAFNALLKILEEPPLSVVFMLATTDPHKIIDTVRSRCFQLIFSPIDVPTLVKHLQMVCKQEELEYEKEGLVLVAQQTEGSVRDALNLIERVKLAYPAITKSSVAQVLGFMSDETLFKLAQSVLSGSLPELITVLQESSLHSYSTQILWKKLTALLAALLLKKVGVAQESAFSDEALQQLVAGITLERLVKMQELCYAYELTFARTSMPAQLFELLLIKLCQSAPPSSTRQQAAPRTSPVQEPQSTPAEQPKKATDWQQFLKRLEAIQDPLLLSLFRQGTLIDVSPQSQHITLAFPQNLTFFQEMLESTTHLWRPHLTEQFGFEVTCTYEFTAQEIPQSKQSPTPVVLAPPKSVSAQPKKYETVKKTMIQDKSIDVSDPAKWQTAQALLKLFPGTIKDITPTNSSGGVA